MAEAKRMRLSPIHEILPLEMVEKVLKLLNYKDIKQAKLICRKWKEIINNGNLVKKASGKYFIHVTSSIIHFESMIVFWQ